MVRPTQDRGRPPHPSGRDLDALSRERGVSPGRLAERRDEAFAAMPAGLQSRDDDHREASIHELMAKLGDRAMNVELLGGGRRPTRESVPGDVFLREFRDRFSHLRTIGRIGYRTLPRHRCELLGEAA